MKKNCSILKALDLADLVAKDIANKNKNGILFKACSCYLKEDGTLHMVFWNDKTKVFDIEKDFPPNVLAYIYDMPLWEVVTVDYCGEDEFAILFYED